MPPRVARIQPNAAHEVAGAVRMLLVVSCFFCFFCSASSKRRRPGECYPDNARLAKALETLAACHEEASFLVPVGAVRAVDSLRALSKGGKALVIAGDKG